MRIVLTADPEVPVPPLGYGGIERIVDALVRHYRARGHEVCLVAHGESCSPADRRVAWPHRSSGGTVATLRHALVLRRVAREFRADIVHSFSRLAYLLPLLPSRLPKVMSYQRHTGGRQIAWAARLGGRSLQFTGCSEYIATMGRRAGGTWSAIHNFVELDRFDFTATVPADAPLVFLSRIEAIKGAHLAIAVARAAGRRLVIAGNRSHTGEGLRYWETEIAPHLGRHGIDYVGEVGDAEKNRLLGSAAALLVPIQWDEPFGIVFAEALAAGTPVISCARGALPEIVTPGENGFFMETVADGVSAVQRLGSVDRAVCRRSAAARFALPACGDRYLDLCTRLAASNQPAP